MTPHTNDNQWRTDLERAIATGQLHRAFKTVSTHLPQGAWRLREEMERTEEAYALMLSYAMDGADDPQRGVVYESIVERLRTVADSVLRADAMSARATLYFNTARYEDMQLDSIASLIDRYKRDISAMSLYNFGGQNGVSSAETEQQERRIFNKIWVTYPLTSTDTKAIGELWRDEVVPGYFKELIASALMLGLTEYYDENRLLLLLDAYAGADVKASLRALCGALIGLYQYRDRINGRKVADRIAALRDGDRWQRDVKMVALQFIRTRDTEKINRTVREELIPRMMQLRPDIEKKMKDAGAMADVTDMEENPEWQELLEKSGIADKMKELSELQEDGADVLMSTFAMLKTFPFFNEVANWFLPFHLDYSMIKNHDGTHDEAVEEMLQASPMLCDGDKYSFLFSLRQVPESQKRMMVGQMNAQNINLAEIREASLLTDDKLRENIVNKYVQDMYRFFKLFRRKGEFTDPFARPLNLNAVTLLGPDLNDAETLNLVGEFYFKRGYYADALRLLQGLCDITAPSAPLYQKIGFCLQQAGDVTGALEQYENAELLNADSLWTLRRIAACHKMLGHTDKALEYYSRIAAKKTDDLNAAMNTGHCLMEAGRPDEAMNFYYKVEFMDEKSDRAWRPIAWCAFLRHDYATASKYYDRLEERGSLTDNDYLNMGHLAMAQRKYRDAICQYNRYLAAGHDVEALTNALADDRDDMIKGGVKAEMIPLLLDTIHYSQK